MGVDACLNRTCMSAPVSKCTNFHFLHLAIGDIHSFTVHNIVKKLAVLNTVYF